MCGVLVCKLIMIDNAINKSKFRLIVCVTERLDEMGGYEVATAVAGECDMRFFDFRRNLNEGG